MAQKHKPNDPFSLFSAAQGLCDSDFSTDDDESDQETEKNIYQGDESTFISKPSEDKCVHTGLPPPNFEKIKKSSFLVDKASKDINWDEIARNYTKEDNVIDMTHTNAMPPPKKLRTSDR